MGSSFVVTRLNKLEDNKIIVWRSENTAVVVRQTRRSLTSEANAILMTSTWCTDVFRACYCGCMKCLSRFF